ncbi:vitamin K epoxide reductase family protein [Thermoleophilia bacterium SCSIO 60948]|nr:vitamin K epoxide reductase family protein [Thermoleophilia bacterium SCSIO 60948]
MKAADLGADGAAQPGASANPATVAFLDRIVGPVMVGSGLLGLGAAGLLTVEKFRVLEDPSYVPACTIDAVLSCGSVMTSAQSEAFGFPNPLIGIAGFAALAALGVVVTAGAQLPRALWLVIQAGMVLAMGFVGWLFFQSVYRIGALCPYCMLVWLATIIGLVYVTVANLGSGRIAGPAALRRTADTVVRYHGVAAVLIVLVAAALIAQAFWDYWVGA